MPQAIRAILILAVTLASSRVWAQPRTEVFAVRRWPHRR